MLPFNPHDGQQKNVIYAALDFRRTQVNYSFVDMCNIFHKYMIFTSMSRHSAISGALTSNKL